MNEGRAGKQENIGKRVRDRRERDKERFLKIHEKKGEERKTV